MAARKNGKKTAAGRGCDGTKAPPEFQPEFLGALNRLVRGGAEVAPDKLLVKVFTTIDKASEIPCVNGPVKLLASREQGDKDKRCAEAVTRMHLVEKVGCLAGAPEGACRQDSVLTAVEGAHAKIETRSRERSFDMKELNKRLPEELKGFAGVPALHAGRIAPTRWGLVKLGRSQGVFIEYNACLETCEKHMLMAFNTKDEPHLEPLEFCGLRFWMTRHEKHTLTAWRGDRDGWLYVLITHCQFRNALAFAQLLRA